MSPGAYALKVKAAALLMLMFNVLMCQQPGTFCFSAASKDFNWKAELWEISRFVDRLVKIFWRNSVEALKPCHIGQGILYQFWSWVNSDKLCHQVPYIHFHGNASTKSLSLSLAVSFLSAYYIPGMIQVYSHGRNQANQCSSFNTQLKYQVLLTPSLFHQPFCRKINLSLTPSSASS